jgi:hypothetical protein
MLNGSFLILLLQRLWKHTKCESGERLLTSHYTKCESGERLLTSHYTKCESGERLLTSHYTKCESGERLLTSHFVRLDIYLHVEITTFLLFGYKTNKDFSVFLVGFGGSPWAPPLALQQKLTINEIYIYFGICPDDRSYWYNRIYKKK